MGGGGGGGGGATTAGGGGGGRSGTIPDVTPPALLTKNRILYMLIHKTTVILSIFYWVVVKTATKLYNIFPRLQSELPKITILLALQTDFAHEIFKIPVASLVTFWKYSGTQVKY
jgi:hypothetical protein